MDVSKNRGTPKSSILIGFSLIFTIHLGGKPPIFVFTPIYYIHLYTLIYVLYIIQTNTLPKTNMEPQDDGFQ